MEQRARAFWGRIKANRLAYTLTILLTLAVGILIGTVISYGVKGKENQGKASDASPLTLPTKEAIEEILKRIVLVAAIGSTRSGPNIAAPMRILDDRFGVDVDHTRLELFGDL